MFSDDTIFEQSGAPVIATNGAGTVQFRNRTAARLLPIFPRDKIQPYLQPESAASFEGLRQHGGLAVLSFIPACPFPFASVYTEYDGQRRRFVFQFLSLRDLPRDSLDRMVQAVDHNVSQCLSVIAYTGDQFRDKVSERDRRKYEAALRNLAMTEQYKRTLSLYYRLFVKMRGQEIASVVQLTKTAVDAMLWRLPEGEDTVTMTVEAPARESDFLMPLDSCDFVDALCPLLYAAWICRQRGDISVSVAADRSAVSVTVTYMGRLPAPEVLEDAHPRPDEPGELQNLSLRLALSARIAAQYGCPLDSTEQDQRASIILTLPRRSDPSFVSRATEQAALMNQEAAVQLAGDDMRFFFLGK